MLIPLLVALMLQAPTPAPATNTICPVLGNKVTAKSKTVEVRGRLYRFCCGGCDGKLKANPEHYLNPDGSPKNAKK